MVLVQWVITIRLAATTVQTRNWPQLLSPSYDILNKN